MSPASLLTAVGVPDPALAVLLRQTQWLLDDIARELPKGSVTAAKKDELAAILETLAALLRREHLVLEGVPAWLT